MGLQLRLESVPSLFSEGCEADVPDFGADSSLSLRAEQARQAQRREALLHESAAQRGLRLGQNLLQALNPRCLATLGPTIDLLWRERAAGGALPDPELALAVPDGLAGLAADLSAPALQAAYARGLHPRGLMGPATFWAPAQRLVRHPADLGVDNGLRGLLDKGELDIAFDRDFDALLIACAARSASSPRMSGRMLRAYAGLFDAGAAHGFEVRDRHGRLAGGGFGVASGGAFVIERWISPQPGAARLGLAVLARHLARWGFRILDGSFAGELVSGMGFAPLPRASYNRRLDAAAGGGRPGVWRVEPDLYAARGSAAAVRHLFDLPPPVAAAQRQAA